MQQVVDKNELLEENIEILKDAIQDYKLVITLLKDIITEQKQMLNAPVIIKDGTKMPTAPPWTVT